MILFLFIFILSLMALNVPIAVALGFPVLVTFAFFIDFPLMTVAQKLYTNVEHTSLMAVPFFILAGEIMERGGVARRLIDFAMTLVGSLPGGMAIAAVLSCMFFASISGSSPATVVAIGSITIPAMMNANYSRRLAVGSVTTAGALGILIPPSITMIIYGFVTETSIPKLFIAGVIPGIFLGLSLMLTCYLVARKEKTTFGRRYGIREKVRAFKNAIWSLVLPLIIVIGIYGFPEFTLWGKEFTGGAIFTPTEASVVVVMYALFVGLVIYREIRWRDIPGIIVHACGRFAMLGFIVTNAILLGFILAFQQVPFKIAHWVISMDLAPWMFLLMINVILFFAGDFMDPIPIVMIFIPILFPAAMKLNIDPVHLGVVVVVNMEMGLVTPPVGLNLYVASGITGIPLYDVLRASLPWIMVIVFVLIVITYVPDISLFLPKLMYGARY